MQLQTKGSELMRRNLKTLLSTAAVVAALAGGPAVYAYAETPMQNESGSMMQDGKDGMMGQGGMMNMMQQMSQMMETCNNMMQALYQDHEPEAPKEGVVPDKEDRKSVVEGKSAYIRGGQGGRRGINTKKKTRNK